MRLLAGRQYVITVGRQQHDRPCPGRYALCTIDGYIDPAIQYEQYDRQTIRSHTYLPRSKPDILYHRMSAVTFLGTGSNCGKKRTSIRVNTLHEHDNLNDDIYPYLPDTKRTPNGYGAHETTFLPTNIYKIYKIRKRRHIFQHLIHRPSAGSRHKQSIKQYITKTIILNIPCIHFLFQTGRELHRNCLRKTGKTITRQSG